MSFKCELTTNTLPTPPPNEGLEHDLCQLLQDESFDKDAALYPSPSMENAGYVRHQYGGSYPDHRQSVGLGIQYNQYEQSSPTYYSTESHQSQAGSPYMRPAVPSPPTPISTHGDLARPTRSGRLRMDSPVCNSRRSTPPRVTKKKAVKVKKTPTLTAPLSVLTKDMVSVPVRDMQAWVNRPRSERIKEAERRNGYVTRPMNSFMLYRSAYSERTKVWCVGTNHQLVSSVSGESWPLEPPEVRDFYNKLAKIERINHQMAHPDYKFSPAKPGAAGKVFRRKEVVSDDESEPSDINDVDADWGATRRTRAKQVKRPGRDAGYPARANLGDARNAQSFQTTHAYDSYAQQQQHSYQQQIPTYQTSRSMHQQDPYARQYYQQQQQRQEPMQGHPQQMLQHTAIDNLGYPIDNLGYGTNNVIGLPSSQSLFDSSHLDPMLFDQHNHLGGGGDGGGMGYDPGFQVDTDMPPPSAFSVGSSSNGMFAGGGEQHSHSLFGMQSETPVDGFEGFWNEERRTSTRSHVSLQLRGVRD
ncbi:HMG box protein [Venturia nashicola]|uniref:HMG box protein n=1 Tax=Venturia nashicola TaxID=86259 RepID=A0A4Z1P268_9PEZI|nr:HMG box protein [Venturia nashicola]TLD34932.1 HMG box protein [Venturia nashicola]